MDGKGRRKRRLDSRFGLSRLDGPDILVVPMSKLEQLKEKAKGLEAKDQIGRASCRERV